MSREEIGPDVRSAINSALDHIQREGSLEYEFFFILAGYLRGLYPGSHSKDIRRARELIPAAQEFGRQVSDLDLGGTFIAFDDPDAAELEFLKAWGKREYGMGGNTFGQAMDIARSNPLELPDHINKWVILVNNLGFCLAEMQTGLPFLIPVNEEVATQAGTSLRTWSLAVQEAIRSKFLTVRVPAKTEGGPRRARRLVFNYQNPHVKAHLQRYRNNVRQLLSKDDPTQKG